MVREFIQERKSKAFTTKSKHNAEFILVRRCEKIQNLLKEQVRLIESSHGMQQLSILCYLVMIITINVFLNLSPIFGGEAPN